MSDNNEVPCNPAAPRHGFDRNASHGADRYVCECEGWSPSREMKQPRKSVLRDQLAKSAAAQIEAQRLAANAIDAFNEAREEIHTRWGIALISLTATAFAVGSLM